MIKVLVQYQSIPESTEAAVVELTQEQFDFLKEANGVYCGLDRDYSDVQYDANRAISEAFASNPENKKYAEQDGFEQWFMLFDSKRVSIDDEHEPLKLEGVQFFINTGFIL